MGMSTDEYRSHLQALLPQGSAWPRAADATLTQLLSALADEFERLDLRVDQLIDEADPRTTLEMLTDWERVLKLPDPCVTESQTTQARRNALVGKLVSIGGQSLAYFIGVAASLGFTVTITEFHPFLAGQGLAADPLTNGDWAYAWRINGPQTTFRNFEAGRSTAGEPLRDWGNKLLECVISRLKPAHTTLSFSYGAT